MTPPATPEEQKEGREISGGDGTWPIMATHALQQKEGGEEWYRKKPYGDKEEYPHGNGSIVFWTYDMDAILAEARERAIDEALEETKKEHARCDIYDSCACKDILSRLNALKSSKPEAHK